MKECLLCDNNCGSVSHVLWECPAYSSLREVALQGMLGDEFEPFSHLVVSRRCPFVLGSKLWENKCDSTLNRISYILDVWELRKVRLYGDNPSIEQSRNHRVLIKEQHNWHYNKCAGE